MTVQIIHASDGYEVSSTDYRHVFSDRDKALFVAQVVALTAATNSGKPVDLKLPESWPGGS